MGVIRGGWKVVSRGVDGGVEAWEVVSWEVEVWKY